MLDQFPDLSAFAIVAAVGLLVGFLLYRAVSALISSRRNYVLIDGSNVMYWRNETPDLAPVKAVLGEISKSGAVPVIWFDANVGYLLSDRYWNESRLALALGLRTAQVRVAPKGTPADPLLLEAAEMLDAPIITNDRYRDWVETYPILRARGLLVRGRWANGGVRLQWPREIGPRRAA